MFTISVFLLLGIAILAILLISVAFAERNFLNKKRNKFRWVYFTCFLILAVVSVKTVKNYIYPKDKSVFPNTDYHILEHKGFRTDSVFYLARGQYPDDFFPEMSLWDGKSGVIKLTPDSIFVSDYFEPFFVEVKNPSYNKKDSLTHHSGNAFVLANKLISVDIAKDGLLLTRTLKNRTDTLFRLSIIDKKDSAYYISSSSRCRPDTSQFKRKINRGYPLSEIIAQSPRFDFNEELQELFDGALLVHERIPITNEFGGESSRRNDSPIVLAPGANLYYADDIRINGSEIIATTQSIHYRGETLFYSGIGRSKTDIYKLSYNPDNQTLDIRYILPKMQKLRPEGGRLFIASSVETILEDSKDGGYYYNIFDNEKNFNHINGEIRYIPGSARENMIFEVMDVYSNNPSEKIQVGASIGENDNEFLLSVKAKSTDKTKWIFDVKDLRESNPLTSNHILIFIVVFVFLVGLRILTDTFVTPHSLSVIELSSYIVIFCLCVVRLILGWRASTFVPIEDISAPVFDKMRSSIWGTTCLVWALPVLMICVSNKTTFASLLATTKSWLLTFKWVKKLSEFFKSKIERLSVVIKGYLKRASSSINDVFLGLFKEKFRKQFWLVWNSAPNKIVVLLYVLVLAVFALLCRGSLERLMNIPAPLLAYIIFDYWLIKRESHSNVTTARVFLAILAFAYLFWKDAGFTIIFIVFLFLYHAVIGTIINGNIIRAILGSQKWSRVSRNRNWLFYLISATFAFILLLFLKYEGDIMIWAFNHIAIVLIGLGVLSACLYVFSRVTKKRDGQNNLLVRIIYAGAAVILLIVGIHEIIPGFSHGISERVNSKVHMKYRAEVQKLRENQRIDDLIEKCDFKSTDITYIMRSAHNQWFINQYLRAGESLNKVSLFNKDKRFFIIQPHSNQGSTYTTQTTDLVITRYVLAEHGNKVVILFMTLFLLLILGYIFEVKLQNSENRAMMTPLLLLFVIALMVFLSATNRVVFVGQDFPFISLQSKVAVLFPLALLFLAIYSVTRERMKGVSSTEKSQIQGRKWAIVVGMSAFSLCCVLFINQQGKKQNEKQFDVSQIIQSLSEKVDLLDKSLMKYQLAFDTNTLQKDSLWRVYSNNVEYSSPLQEILSDKTDTNRFYRSLIEYFDTRQAIKNNPEELLHMRKRSGYWHLALNKKHFFIPSMLEESLQWTGDLLAAKTKSYFSFKSTHSSDVRRLTSNSNYEKNILPPSIQNQVENVQISRFDSAWSDDGQPIILINSYKSIGSPQYYHIESAGGTIKGSSAEHQIATRIREGDLVMVNKLDKRGEENEVLGWKYGEDNENFLAKNIWMNGHQRLFYPLGKESMWSYQFANAVSSAFGSSETYRDSTLRVSIDYDLHKRFYDILSVKNVTRSNLRFSTVQQLLEFETLPLSEMQNINNVSSFYYDNSTRKIIYKKRNASKDIDRAVARINRLLARSDNDLDRDTQISNAIEQVIERKFDFSAVVLDGNGRIRLLFDHTRSRNIDPNDIRYFNKYMSDMYKNGDNQSERDIFGNKALQILPSGPGSSFKPIAYTAITSRQKIAWEQLDVLTRFKNEAMSAPKPNTESTNTMYDYYGGVDCARLGQPLSIDGNSGLMHNNYIIQSNNLYHSTIILLGMQPQDQLERVFMPAGRDKYAFPVMRYKNQDVSFNPNIWFPNNKLNPQNGIMNDGLLYNFNLRGDIINSRNRYSNFFGNSPELALVFKDAPNYRVWTYPETGSHNIPDRRLAPQLRNGFNQMLLGAYPLEVTPLQMATMGMRLATLNRAPSITTLSDNQRSISEYSFFEVPTWENNNDYFKFVQRQVFSQMRQVPLTGTARALSAYAQKLSKQGYYMYAKTGTLNDGRARANKNSRMKHLLVIISNRQLERLASIDDLQSVKYYVLYLSYLGVNVKDDGFNNMDRFQALIDAVVKSELFQEYMEED